MSVVLVDAGPLVALINRDDPHHAICLRAFRSVPDALLTVWPALTEAMYLLGAASAQDALWELVHQTPIGIALLTGDDLPRMRELMRKYRDLPMDLADAALVRIAERDRVRRIFTLDRRDFSVYRLSRIGRLEVIP